MKSIKQLGEMYRKTKLTGHTPTGNIDCLFDADQATNNKFYKTGRKLFTIESVLKRQQNEKQI